MPVEYLTLAVQVVILATVGFTGWNIFRTMRATAKTLSVLQEYRREMQWLTWRVEAAEGEAVFLKRRVEGLEAKAKIVRGVTISGKNMG
jgi:hypothetical protein